MTTDKLDITAIDFEALHAFLRAAAVENQDYDKQSKAEYDRKLSVFPYFVLRKLLIKFHHKAISPEYYDNLLNVLCDIKILEMPYENEPYYRVL